MNLLKKVFSGWLIVFLLLGSLFLIQPKKTEATGMPVIDISHSLITGTGWLAQAARFALEQAMEAALTALKKRLLDTLVDQIITWIQGGGKPKFVENFEYTLEDAKQAAIGDVVQKIGLGRICQPLQKVSLRIGLQEPAPFSQRISCTLTDVIDNIDDFMDDFSKGGWVGYHELLKPNNNIYGQWLMAAEETNNQIKKKQISLQQEVTVGQGFLGVKRCLEWTFYGRDNYGEPMEEDKFPFDSNNFPYDDPNIKPPVLPMPDGYSGYWECSKPVITTPGGAIAKGLEKALYSDLDFILTADELSQYIGAIADAAINRLIKEGVKGVQSLGEAGSTTDEERDAWNRDNFSDDTRRAIDDYTRSQTDILNLTRNAYLEPLNNAITALNNASSSLGGASVQNQNLITDLDNLITCLRGRSQDAAWADNALANASTTTLQIIRSATDQINSLRERVEETKDIINNARTLNDLNGVDRNQITGWLTNSNSLEIQANDILNQVKTTKDDAENRLQRCLGGS